jgi:predicted transcriptional regulator
MATKLPRLLVTLSHEDVAKVEALAEALKMPRARVMRLALRQLHKEKLSSPK